MKGNLKNTKPAEREARRRKYPLAMKTLITAIAASTALIGSMHAGAPVIDYKPVAPVIVYYGTGWYGAIQGGVNAYQSLGGAQSYNRNSNEFIDVDGDGTRIIKTRRGNKVELDPNGSGIGGFGGIKLGYVFGTGTVRPALEADLFYNGLDTDIDVKVNGKKVADGSARIDSGAFLLNSLVRFSFDQFQPYVGFGLGAWVAEGNDVDFKVNGETRRSHSETSATSGLAWQIVAGADYYFTPKVSMFFEYKFLNYVDAVLDNTAQQQLFGLGVRFHF
jgi:opacity protein-like surface antigen